jgi:hypothetical protein
LLTMHEILDAEVGSRHVVGNDWVAVDRQIRRGQ